ncbi:hypothetical protein AAFN86_28230 [Roseomonas sp. CAU 1739]
MDFNPERPASAAIGSPVTIIRSIQPAMVCKRYTMGAAGIEKRAVAHVTEGEATTRDVPDAAAMMALLREVTEAPDLVICPGVFRDAGDQPFRVVPEKQFATMLNGKVGEVPGGVHDIHGSRVAARLKRGISPGAWLLLDADNPPGMPEAWQRQPFGERLGMLDKIIPGISTCERIELRGSSARVVQDGASGGAATHAWIRVSDPARIAVLKAYATIASVTAGLSFASPRHSRIEPGKVVGHQQRTVVDLSVWDTGRLVFCACPDVQVPGYSATPAGIELVNPGGGALDLSGIVLPGKPDLDEYAARTGHRVDIEEGREAPVIRSYGDLTWETEIESRGQVKRLREWVATMRPGGKKRCETPFRASSSEAAVIRLRRDGKPILHDVGTGTTYHLSEEPPPEAGPAYADSFDTAREQFEAEGHGRSNRPASDSALHKGPLIQVVGGNLHNEATEGESALLHAGRAIYQRGCDLVRPAVQIVAASRGRMTHSAALVEIGCAGLRDALCQVAHWEKFDKRSSDWVEINPPADVAMTILARTGEWRFPRIAGVITTPTLRPDGTLLSEHGYDPATRLYHMADPELELRPSVHNPTRANAEAALELLRSLLAEFPFDGDVSRAVGLSGLITPVVRGALSVAPLHAFKATSPGSGKSYLVDVVSAISTGRPCPVTSVVDDERETEKRLTGMLLAGYPIACLDNVNGELGGDLLCQAIERPIIRVRKLGGSDLFEIENKASMFATGNALRVRGDMVRRTLVCSLDAGVERPELRDFKADPIAKIQANRGLYVSACLVIVRAYLGVGLPGLPKAIASFEDWSGLVRGALVWLGCADPAASMQAARDDDPELTELREMLALWSDAFGSDAMTAKEVADAIHQKEPTQMGEPTDYRRPDLRDALIRLVGERGEVNTKRLGRWLLSREGRIVDGQRFKRSTTKGQNNVARWQVVATVSP